MGLQDLFSGKNKTPAEVFTPRAADVNSEMYIARPELENELRQALESDLHVVIHGESGSGKSWLYKKVFEDLGVMIFTANLANASRLGSINKELENLANQFGLPSRASYSESSSAELNAAVAKGAIQHQSQYTMPQLEPFEACLKKIREKAGRQKSILVFENLEQVFNKDGNKTYIDELADLIVLLDDPRYSVYKVKLAIVGVPHDLRRYYFSTGNKKTVANRLREIPEVSRLSKEQCVDLIIRGFTQQLRYRVHNDIAQIAERISFITDRVPQRVHEYCLVLANLGLKDRLVDAGMLAEANKEWLNQSLYYARTAVQSVMNARDSRIGRRNQVLFAIGFVEQNDFKYSDIEAIVRREFPTSTRGKTLNVAGQLSSLSTGENALIKRTPRNDSYIFSDPVFKMCIRTMLVKRNETVDQIVPG